MDFADSNFIVAAFLPSAHSTSVERFLRRQAAPIRLGDLVELECRGVFARMTGSPDSDAWQRLQAQLASGSWGRIALPWTALLEDARSLQDRVGVRLAIGCLDTLHVAAARQSGCRRFLSFDTNSHARILAASAGLRVWPELTAAEKARVLR